MSYRRLAKRWPSIYLIVILYIYTAIILTGCSAATGSRLDSEIESVEKETLGTTGEPVFEHITEPSFESTRAQPSEQPTEITKEPAAPTQSKSTTQPATVTPTPIKPTATASSSASAETTPGQDTSGSDRNELAEGFFYVMLDDTIKARITGMSYPADDSNSAVHYDDLRYIKLLHYDFAGSVHEGELIVHKSLADEVMVIFYELYQAKYPLASVRLVDDYGEPGDDNVSMAANNTSAFNYRYVTGTKILSWHSYGAAVDINPMLNPYLVGDRIAPENGAEYVDRTRDFAGKIDHNDLCYQLFIARGWAWGGDWRIDKDYQHFSKKISS